MSISTDRVFRTVLRILNKESRGTMTPDEFAKVGTQVQLELIDKAIYDYNNALNKRKGYMANEGYANIPDKIREKIDAFSEEANITFTLGEATLPTGTLRILDLSSSDRTVRYEEVSKNELSSILRSPLTAPSIDFPVFFRKEGGDTVQIYPNVAPLNAATAKVDYLAFPSVPRWGYFINSNHGGKTYDSNVYVATGLVVREDAFTSFTTNISGGVDGTYNVEATISTGGTITLRATISGGIVTAVETVDAGSGFVSGTTLTVSTVIGAPDGTNLPVGGASADLVITIANENIYQNSTAGSTNFTLHPSEEINLIKGILAYSGLILGDAQITAQATQIMQANEISKQ